MKEEKSKLSISLMPYGEIASLGSAERIKKILSLVLAGKVVILQGQLKAEEESRLIEDTMALIGHISGFRGIELAVLENKEEGAGAKFKNSVARMLIGQRNAMTVIGPANIVKEIKRNPKKLEILLK